MTALYIIGGLLAYACFLLFVMSLCVAAKRGDALSDQLARDLQQREPARDRQGNRAGHILQHHEAE